jgi:hypothetical protein
MNANSTANRIILHHWLKKRMVAVFLGCKNMYHHRMDDQINVITGYVEEINEYNLAVLFHPNIQRNVISLCETS